MRLIKPRIVVRIVEKPVYFWQSPTQVEEPGRIEELRLGDVRAPSEEPGRTEEIKFGDVRAPSEEPTRSEAVTIWQM